MGHELPSTAPNDERPPMLREPLVTAQEGALQRLAGAFVDSVAGVTSRRKLWHHIRSVRFGSGVTAYAEFNVMMQALGREATLRKMVRAENAERIERFLSERHEV